MKGEVTLKKNSKTKFTVYLNSEKIGELNQTEETVGREDDIAYLWFWDPAGDRFRDRELENGGYYNPNKLFSEIEELVARTPEKKKGTAIMRRQAQLQELLQQYESASGRIIKMLTQAHQAALGKKFDQANRILQKLDGVVEDEVLSGLMGLNDTMAGVVGFEASSTQKKKEKKAMVKWYNNRRLGAVSSAKFWKYIRQCKGKPSKFCVVVPKEDMLDFYDRFRDLALTLENSLRRGSCSDDTFGDGVFAAVFEGQRVYKHLLSMIKSGNEEGAADAVCSYGHNDAGDTKAYLTDLEMECEEFEESPAGGPGPAEDTSYSREDVRNKADQLLSELYSGKVEGLVYEEMLDDIAERFNISSGKQAEKIPLLRKLFNTSFEQELVPSYFGRDVLMELDLRAYYAE